MIKDKRPSRFDDCPQCGQPKEPRAKLCLSCHQARYVCPTCGGSKDHRAKQCMKCAGGSMTGTKTCTKCGIEKPVSEFRIRTRAKPRPRSYCKECEATYTRERRATPERKKALAEYKRKRYASLSPDEKRRHTARIASLKIGLSGKELERVIGLACTVKCCEICGRHTDVVGTLHIDHDHTTGKFRGMLCSACNTGLGQMQDSIDILKKALVYLEHHLTR